MIGSFWHVQKKIQKTLVQDAKTLLELSFFLSKIKKENIAALTKVMRTQLRR